MLLGLFHSKKTSDDSPACTSKKKTKLQSESDQIAFSSYARESGLPTLVEWPSQSSMVVIASHRNNYVKYTLPRETSLGRIKDPLPMDGSVITFSGPLFEGKLVSRTRDVNEKPPSDGNLMSNE